MPRISSILVLFLLAFIADPLLNASVLLEKTGAAKSTRAVAPDAPEESVYTFVQKFDEKADLTMWIDADSKKIYLKVIPVSEKIFINNNTHSILQVQNSIEQSFTLKLMDPDTNLPFFDYVYKNAPKVLEIVVDDGQNFMRDESFDFMFESTYSIASTRKSEDGTQCVNIDMQSGWTLASLPVAITLYRNTTDANESMDLLGAFSEIYVFREGAWEKNPDTLYAGEGFWIQKETSSDVEFCGPPYYPLLEELTPGWHLVGTGRTLYHLNELGYVENTYHYANSSWGQSLPTVNPGEGFWMQIGEGEALDFPALPVGLSESFEPLQGALVIDVNSSKTITKIDDYIYTVQNANSGDYDSFISLPLFVNGVFEGIIVSVTQSNTDVTIVTQDANTVEEAFESFKIAFTGIQASPARSSSSAYELYNYLNIEPVSIHSVSTARTVQSGGQVVRMAIPDNFILTQEATVHTRYRKEIPIAVDLGGLGISFMNNTGWSYLEFTIDPDLDLDIGWNRETGEWFGSPYLTYDFQQTVNNNQEINVEVYGKLAGNVYDKTFNILRAITGRRYFSIPIPYSMGAISIRVFPQFQITAGGELTGKYTYKYVKKFGTTTTVHFDSRSENPVQSSRAINSDSTTKSHAFALEGSFGVGFTPKLRFAPAVGISKLSTELNIVMVDAGYEMSAKATGVIAASESGVVDKNHPYSRVYAGNSFFNPYYLTVAAEGQAFASGLIDLSDLPFIDKPYDLKFAVLPKQVFGVIDFGIMPQPEVRELSTESDEKKKLEIAFQISIRVILVRSVYSWALKRLHSIAVRNRPLRIYLPIQIS